MMDFTGKGGACILVGLTKTEDGLINWTKCVWKEEKSLGSLELAATRILFILCKIE